MTGKARLGTTRTSTKRHPMSGEIPIAELIGRVRDGDARAAEELVRRYEPLIRREVRFRLHDSRLRRVFDSMDVCQPVLASFFLISAASIGMVFLAHVPAIVLGAAFMDPQEPLSTRRGACCSQ